MQFDQTRRCQSLYSLYSLDDEAQLLRHKKIDNYIHACQELVDDKVRIMVISMAKRTDNVEPNNDYLTSVVIYRYHRNC